MATIKKGTYRFNDVLTFPTENDIEQDVNYTIRLVISALEIDAIATFKNIKISKVDGRPTDVMCWLTDDLATAYDTDAVQIYAEGKWNTAYLDDHIKTLTIAEEQEVSDEFYAWFTANAVEQKEISGVWKWKDELTVPTNEPIYEDVNFTVETSVSGMYEGTAYCNNITIEANFYADELERNALWYNVNELVPAFPYLQTPIALPICEAVHRLRKETLWHSDDFGEGIKTIDFGTEPQYVSIDFYNWLTANATQPTASITHNGSTIAELFPGQTATLKCKGMKMEDDVVVEVAELPEVEVVEPVLQEKTVTENGEVVPDDGYDGLSKVTVAVEATTPIEDYDGTITIV